MGLAPHVDSDDLMVHPLFADVRTVAFDTETH